MARSSPERVALDTSVVIALVCGWHARHADVVRTLEAKLDAGAELVLPAHALAESYAVLTRLPSPHRISPTDAWKILGDNFGTGVRLLALGAADYRSTLGRLAAAGVAGGHTYDGLIAAAASKAGAATLLSLDARQFRDFEGTHLRPESVRTVG